MPGYHFDPQDYEELQNIVNFASDMVATPFDASKSYAVGEYCRRESGFYVRNTAGSGAWDASKWTPTTVGDALKAANAEISALNATLTQFTNGFSVAPTAPSAYNSMVTDINDGYVKIGRLVFVSCYFVMAQSSGSSGSQVLSGLPLPVGTRNLQAMNLDTNAVLFAFVNTSGRVGIGQATSGSRISLEGVYFARS